MDNNETNINSSTIQPANNGDPTGQELQNMTINSIPNDSLNVEQDQNDNINIQNNLQSIATVDQSNEQFINNTQSVSQNTSENSNDKMDYPFIIIIFIIIFASIFFLFPMLFSWLNN